MKHSRLISSCSVILLFSIASCRPFDPDDSTPPKQIEGWAPVYAESGIAIKSSTARTIENGGKIYIKGSRLYQVETGKGIHILNIIDAKNEFLRPSILNFNTFTLYLKQAPTILWPRQENQSI